MNPAKVVVVTGAARGIGRAIAERFVSAGWAAALLDIDAATLRGTTEALTPRERIFSATCDISQPGQVQATIAEVSQRFGRIDALVNNAGIAIFKPILETSFEEWSRVLAVNLSGVFLCSQAVAPLMVKQGSGSIVNIASISGLRASTLRVAYGTSKAGVIQLTKQQAAELGNVGVRVNCVAPGPIETDMAKQVHTADIRRSYHDAVPLNRYGTTQEIAEAVFFLCSDAASYINGQTLAVDGGFDVTGVGLPNLRAR